MSNIEEIITRLTRLKGTPTIEQRAKAYSKTQAIECYAYCGYEKGATEQRQIDIENCVKWCENFNKNAEETGCIERIDVESFRQWITNMIMNDEQD